MSKMNQALMAENGILLKDCIYENASLYEVSEIGSKGRFNLIPTDFNSIRPDHHDLLVIPSEMNDEFLCFIQK